MGSSKKGASMMKRFKAKGTWSKVNTGIKGNMQQEEAEPDEMSDASQHGSETQE